MFVGLGAYVDELFAESVESCAQLRDAVVMATAHQVLGTQQQLLYLVSLHLQTPVTFLQSAANIGCITAVQTHSWIIAKFH